MRWENYHDNEEGSEDVHKKNFNQEESCKEVEFDA